MKIKLENAEHAEFLIGLPNEIPDYEIIKSAFFMNQAHLDKAQRRFVIFPGQSFYIGNSNVNDNQASYFFDAVGNVKTIDFKESNNMYSNPVFWTENYNIRIIKQTNQKVKTIGLLSDLKKDILQQGLPSIVFIGDLNHDDTPDFIIRYNTSYAVSHTRMFLSGYSDKKFISKVFESHWGSCY